MLTFVEWNMMEAINRDATNIPHIENLVIDKQIDGAKEAAAVLQEIYEHYAGTGEQKLNVQVKIDGAPSIIVGPDPEDGEFFIGLSKSILGSKNPKYAKSLKEIDKVYANSDPELINILKTAFVALKGLSWSVPLQGDVLFTRQGKKIETIDGEQHITFKPNLIVYAVPLNSILGKRIAQANFGISFHTTLSGDTITDFIPKMGANIKELDAPLSVFTITNDYKNLGGEVKLRPQDTSQLNKELQEIQSKTVRLEGNKFLTLLKNTPLLRTEFKTFQNTLVNEKLPITLRPETFGKRFVLFLGIRASKLGDRAKKHYSELGKAVTAVYDDVVQVLEWQSLIVKLKLQLIEKLDNPNIPSSNRLEPYYNLGKGITSGDHEGYVATDMNGNFVKLVDRLDYSSKNKKFGRFAKK